MRSYDPDSSWNPYLELSANYRSLATGAYTAWRAIPVCPMKSPIARWWTILERPDFYRDHLLLLIVLYYRAIWASKQGVSPCLGIWWCNHLRGGSDGRKDHSFWRASGGSRYWAGDLVWVKTELRAQEVAALRAGIDLGPTVIDTAENGRRRRRWRGRRRGRFTGNAIAWCGVLESHPWNAGERKIASACEASLRRLNTDYLDLYLLHWRGDYSLEETVPAWKRWLRRVKFAAGGVSNLDNDDMHSAWQVEGGERCATNQVPLSSGFPRY